MELQLGKRYPIKVLKLIRTGIIVQIGDNPSDTGLIHLSRISKLFVDDVSKFVEVGSTYEAEAIKGKVTDIELSLLHMNLQPIGAVIHVDLAKRPDRTAHHNVRAKQTIPSRPMTLDDMIDKMNKDYTDKTQAMNSRERRKNKR